MKKILTILLPSLLLLNGCSSERHINNVTSNENSSSTIELIQTKQEEAEWSWDRWKNWHKEADLVEIIDAGLNGDRGALYLVGLMNMMGGNGITVDVETANSYFACSASLGFAPGLDKVRSMYLYDKPNFYLMMIYLNLTIAAGHHEFIKSYHKLRNDIVEKLGENIAREIEKIALHKQNQIDKNLIELNRNKTTNFIASDAFQSITAEDSLFDNDYWFKVHKGNITIGR